LGRAITLALAQAGYDVCIHHRHHPEQAATAAAEVRATGRRATVVCGELSDTQQVRAVIEHALHHLHGLDLVVACAASYRTTDPEHASADHLDQVLAENARGPVDLLMQVYPHLHSSRDGRAIVVGDLAGLTPFRGYLAHSMAKAAVHMAVRSLAVEWAPHVLVNAVVPGAVLPPETMPASQWAGLQTRVPLGGEVLRNPQLPVQAVADAVLWLARAPRFVTGQLIPVDGGRTARW